MFDRKHVLRPIGLIPLAEWNRCKELSEQGEVVVPTFEPVEDQQDLCRKIDIPYFRVSSFASLLE